MTYFICNIKGHEPANFTLGNGGVIEGVRTITARCEHCHRDIECRASGNDYGTVKVTEWSLRVSPVS